jgi:hypothetical protein
MKKKYFLIIFISLAVITSGCLDDDGYSLGKMWVGFGMVEQVNSDPPDYKITMDNGDILTPVASDYHYPWYYYSGDNNESRLKTGDRILINYTIIGDNAGSSGEPTEYFIKVNAVKKILLKGILDITPENQDSIGNDPVIVQDCWQKDSLLNFELKYWGRYKTHFINLVKEPGELTESSQPIELELRHNDNDDVNDFPYSAYVSFSLNELKIEGLDSVQFRVTSTDYDGDLFEYEGVFRYNENN